jgi:hypothetical protein
MVDAPRNTEVAATEAVLIVRAGWRTNLGKDLRSKKLWGETLTAKEYEEVIFTKSTYPSWPPLIR